ncbi:MAG: prefoldin subunit alpha [Nitrososphaerota archaeon]
MSVKITRGDIERAISELTILERIVRELQARLLALESSIGEHNRSLELLDEIAKHQGEVKGLMPIGAGVLAEGVITSPDTFRVNIGDNVFIDMSLDRCRGWLMARRQRLEQAHAETSRALQSYSERAEAVRRFLASIERAVGEEQSGKGEA